VKRFVRSPGARTDDERAFFAALPWTSSAGGAEVVTNAGARELRAHVAACAAATAFEIDAPPGRFA